MKKQIKLKLPIVIVLVVVLVILVNVFGQRRCAKVFAAHRYDIKQVVSGVG